MKPLLSILLPIFLFFYLPEISANDNANRTVAKGILDLRSWDGTPTNMDGEWKFYWNQFISEIHPESYYQFLYVPSTWKSVEWKLPNKNNANSPNSAIIPAEGFATYQITILVNSDFQKGSYGIWFKDFGSSYRAFANKNLISYNGKVGKTSDDYEFNMKPNIATLPKDVNGEILLEVEIANFDNTNGGFWNHAMIGEISQLHKRRFNSISLNFLFFGITGIIGSFSIIFFFYLKNQKSSFYFGLFSILLGLRISLTNERPFTDLFEFLPFSIIYKLEYLSFYLAPPLYAHYLKNLFPQFYPKIAFSILNTIIMVCVLSVILLPASLYTNTVMIVQPLIFFYATFSIIVLYRSFSIFKYETILIASSFVFLFFTVINDILYHASIFKIVVLVPFGLIFFIFLQAILLGRRLASAYIRSKALSNELKELNSNLEETISIRTKDLKNKIQIITEDLEMAKKIQTRILGKMELVLNDIEFQALYEPIDNLGGDYFDIMEMSPSMYRVMIADATGHGIQASLVTMAIKSEFEYAKYNFNSPHEVIHFLNQQFCKKYEKLKMYFTCFIVDIDTNKGILTYSSAGHPEQIKINNKKEIEILHARGMIVGMTPEVNYVSHSTSFQKDDVIFLFTDGWIEQFNKSKIMYEEKRFYQSMQNNKSVFLRKSIQDIHRDFLKFAEENELQDDLAMVGILRK
jgi:sigma-B regulation protein RsbU (phosphoserine phosphatase)